MESRIDPRDRCVTLRLVNRGAAALTFMLRSDTGWPRRITVRAGGSRTVDWPTAAEHGWYDLTIVTSAGGFHRRLAGHIENGRESVTG